MEEVLGEFLAWISQTAQAIFTAAPEAASQIASQSATAFSQLKIIVGIEVPRYVERISPAELLVAAGLALLIIGIRKRLYYRGVFAYVFGLGSLILGLGNIVNPAALPLFLQV